jgi:hypothetical protein
MTILETLKSDMATSMKAGDAPRTGVIRLLRSAMQNEKIKQGRDLSDEDALKVLQREAKQRRDSITQYGVAGRQDLIYIEAAELEVITAYLPQALSQAELEIVVDGVIARLGATDMKQMGAVIGMSMKEVGARAEGGAVSAIVKAKLGNS